MCWFFKSYSKAKPEFKPQGFPRQLLKYKMYTSTSREMQKTNKQTNKDEQTNKTKQMGRGKIPKNLKKK